MSKFSVKIKLQGLEIEVEGSHEDAHRLANKVGEQITNAIKPPLLIEMSKTPPPANESDSEARRKRKPVGGGGGAKSSAEDLVLSHDPSTHGSPSQDWSTAQKAIWLLWVAKSNKPLSGYSIAKAFNKYFKSARAINAGNVGRDLEKERLKGTASLVGADVADGTARYYLTDAGKAMGAQLAKGIAA